MRSDVQHLGNSRKRATSHPGPLGATLARPGPPRSPKRPHLLSHTYLITRSISNLPPDVSSTGNVCQLYSSARITRQFGKQKSQLPRDKRVEDAGEDGARFRLEFDISCRPRPPCYPPPPFPSAGEEETADALRRPGQLIKIVKLLPLIVIHLNGHLNNY